MHSTKFQIKTGVIIFLISFAALFFTLEDPGMTIDEPYVNREAAISFAAWLEAAKEDIFNGNWGHFTSAEVIGEYFKPEYTYHPPFSRLWTGVTWRLFHKSLGEIKALRLAPAILFSISVALLFLLISERYGFLPGIFASMGYLSLPSAFGHAHLIALDSPIASMWFITAFCFVRGINGNLWAILFGITLGLTMNTKIHGFALPFPLFLWGLAYHRRRMAANIWACVVFTPLTLYLSNPLYWHYPMHVLVDYLANMMDKETYERIPTSFLGERYDFSPPKYYAPFMVAVTTSPWTLIFSLMGMIMGGAHAIGRKLTRPPNADLDMFLSLNFFAALALTMFKNIPLYDGVRLFLPAFPFVSGLAGSGLFHLSRCIKKENIKLIISTGLTGLALICSIVSLVRIHPFELSYFNMFIGGLPGAKKLGLEPTYWNDAFTLKTAKMMKENYPNKVFSRRSGIGITFDYYREIGALGENITQSKTDYDFHLLQHRLGWFKSEHWFYSLYLNPEYSVKREGVPLLEIYKPLKILKKERDDFEAVAIGSSGGFKNFEWRKYLIVKKTGSHRFGILTAQENKLWIDFKRVDPLPEKYQDIWEYEVFLEKGVHVLKLDFPRLTESPRFFPAWIFPEEKKGVIPREVLVPMENFQGP